MKLSISEQFLAATIFSGTFTLMMMTGGMMYAIYCEIDGGTEISMSSENPAAPQASGTQAVPAPGTGIPAGSRTAVYDCKDLVYQVSHEGIHYVREAGGIDNAALVNGRVRFYRLDYGHLRPVSTSALDPASIRKLGYALQNCNGTYIRSGAQILAGNTESGTHI